MTPPGPAEGLPSAGEWSATDAPPGPATLAPDAGGSVIALPTAGSAFRRVNFSAPSFLSNAELRQLQLRHDELVRSLATRLSIYLRLEFAVQVARLETLSHRKLVEGLPCPTHLTLFKIDSLNGLGLLEVPPPLGLAIVDRLLGGPGQPPNSERPLTEIEVELLDLAGLLLLKEWGQQVAHLPEARPQILGHETNARYLQAIAADTPLLVVTLAARLNDTAGDLKLAVPSSMIEPLLRHLHPALGVKPVEPAPAPAAPSSWPPHLNDVPVQVSAHWDGLEITARDLAQLQVGDVLQVAPHQVNHVRVCVGSQPKFVGRLGTRDQTWAVELTRPL